MNKENLKKSLFKNFKKLIMILPEKFSNEFLLLNEFKKKLSWKTKYEQNK